ncbi:MAG: DUF1501 domain-containing protein [Blastocatellia bacterium]
MAYTRRKFIRESACAAGAASLLGTLNHTAAAVSPAAQTGDYKALVCVFLFGGNDGDNTLIPYGQTAYNEYAKARSILAIPRASLLPIRPRTSDGREWALHPGVPEMQSLFTQGKLAILANCGTLLAPTTRDQFLKETVPLPPQLFSHNDQQTQWQTSLPDQLPRTGWAGRAADAVNSLNPAAPISMSVSLVSGSNIFQVGNQVFPYTISGDGTIQLWYYNETWGNVETKVTKAFLDANYNNLLEKGYRDTFKRAIENEQRLRATLASAPALTTVFPDKNNLAKQLKMAAKMISVRNALGMRRQIFFCSADGFDTHGEQLTTHAQLLGNLSKALDAFYKATVELGVATQVTTFTASDFGRTWKSNGKGSDHGWGNHQMIIGGAVRGGDIFNRVPNQVFNGGDDAGDGRWIPTVSTDEYAATLATWFGVNAGDLSAVLPNIGRFNRPNLGFMS